MMRMLALFFLLISLTGCVDKIDSTEDRGTTDSVMANSTETGDTASITDSCTESDSVAASTEQAEPDSTSMDSSSSGFTFDTETGVFVDIQTDTAESTATDSDPGHGDGDTALNSDSDVPCNGEDTVRAVCDDVNNVIAVDSCGSIVALLEHCGEAMICESGACYCPMGYTGEKCDVPLIYVNINRLTPKTATGRSWAEAFTTLTEAFELAATFDSADIWVAAGTYYPEMNNRSGLQLVENVRVFGGFLGSERSFDARDFKSNVTILSGDTNRDDHTLSGDVSDNAMHVVLAADNAVLDGFTVQGGHAEGLYLIDNCGGGLLAQKKSMIVRNCVFRDNWAQAYGGGIYVEDAGANIESSLMTNNASDNGAGVAVVMQSANSKLSLLESMLDNVGFDGNEAESNGGGLYISSTAATITGCRFVENFAGDSGGGAVVRSLAASNFLGNEFVRNQARNGGGLLVEGIAGQMNNNLFYGNSIGAMLCRSGVDVNDDEAVVRPQCLRIGNTTFVGNTANETNAVFMAGENSFPVILNTIFWGNIRNGAKNAPSIGAPTGSLVTVANSILQLGCPVADAVLCGEKIHKFDPRFSNITEGDLTLTAISPAIDAGENKEVFNDVADLDSDGNTGENAPFDLAGNSRIVDGDSDDSAAVDLGAFEFVFR